MILPVPSPSHRPGHPMLPWLGIPQFPTRRYSAMRASRRSPGSVSARDSPADAKTRAHRRFCFELESDWPAQMAGPQNGSSLKLGCKCGKLQFHSQSNSKVYSWIKPDCRPLKVRPATAAAESTVGPCRSPLRRVLVFPNMMVFAVFHISGILKFLKNG